MEKFRVWLKSTVEKESSANLNTAHSGAAKKTKQKIKTLNKYTENSLIKKWHIVLYFYRQLLLLLSFACFECVHQIPAK